MSVPGCAFEGVWQSIVNVITLDDDSERPMDYQTSLLPKVFFLNYLYHISLQGCSPHQNLVHI